VIDKTFLRRHAMFGGLTDAQLTKVTPYLREGSFERGDTILEEGKMNNAVYFILLGQVGVDVTCESEPSGCRRVFEMGEGDSFGEMELIDIQPCAATIRALSPVRILALSSTDLHHLMKEDQTIFSMIIMNLARDISRRLRKMDKQFSQGG